MVTSFRCGFKNWGSYAWSSSLHQGWGPMPRGRAAIFHEEVFSLMLRWWLHQLQYCSMYEEIWFLRASCGVGPTNRKAEPRCWLLNPLGRGVYVAPLFRATSSLGCLLVQQSRSNFCPFLCDVLCVCVPFLGSNLNPQIEQSICKPQLPNKN